MNQDCKHLNVLEWHEAIGLFTRWWCLDCGAAMLDVTRGWLLPKSFGPWVGNTGQVTLPMVLFCPTCGRQHIDHPEPEKGWANPPHKSHLCHNCRTIWRPADVCTEGVAAIVTRGEHDTFRAARPTKGCIKCQMYGQSHSGVCEVTR